jgi:hypothetical protein
MYVYHGGKGQETKTKNTEVMSLDNRYLNIPTHLNRAGGAELRNSSFKLVQNYVFKTCPGTFPDPPVPRYSE